MKPERVRPQRRLEWHDDVGEPLWRTKPTGRGACYETQEAACTRQGHAH